MSPNHEPGPVSRRIGEMTVTLKSNLDVEFTRVFAAPRRLVFEAHAKAEHVRRWWGPRDSTMTGAPPRPGTGWPSSSSPRWAVDRRPQARAIRAGAMFLFIRKTLSGSQRALISARRSRFWP